MRATKSGKDRLTGEVGAGRLGGAGQLDVTQHISSKESGGGGYFFLNPSTLVE